MSPREARQAKNEALFREVNERIAELATNRWVGDEILIICECATIGCATQLTVSLDGYREVRSQPDRFLVAPGHVDPEIESVVERNAEFEVVEKHADVPIP